MVLVTQVEVAGQLHSDGARAFLRPEDEIFHHCLHETDNIHSPMTVEILVFRGDQSINHGFRDLLQREVRAVLDVKHVEHFTIHGIDLGGQLGFRVFDALQRGKG